MKRKVHPVLLIIVSLIYSFVLTVGSIVPVFGPSFVGYYVGKNRSLNRIYGLKNVHLLIPVIISAGISFLICCALNYAFLGFFHPELFWDIAGTIIALNFITTIMAYSAGYRWSMRNKK